MHQCRLVVNSNFLLTRSCLMCCSLVLQSSSFPYPNYLLWDGKHRTRTSGFYQWYSCLATCQGQVAPPNLTWWSGCLKGNWQKILSKYVHQVRFCYHVRRYIRWYKKCKEIHIFICIFCVNSIHLHTVKSDDM